MKGIDQHDLTVTQTPKVSVLVTTYNHELFIAECLNSILNQKRNFSVEILIADDASTDATPKIIKDFKAQFPDVIKPIFLDINQRSQCLPVYSRIYQYAIGQFIATCDGDDFWSDENKLQKQVDFLSLHSSYAFSFHNAIGLNKDLKFNSEVSLPAGIQRDHQVEELLCFTGWIYLGTIVFRKAFPVLPPEFDLVPNRDHLLPILLSAYGAAKYQGEVGDLIYRQHTGASWSTKTPFDKAVSHARTGLIITAYLLRTGNHVAAKTVFNI
jgi:glycosyltransferase involved in cell wall biosynthesis